MFHPLLRLVEDPERGWRMRATTSRAWRPTLLVPRGLCVFESLPCKGVRWHELDGFARLQARRLAPFLRTGVSAAVRHDTLMLWFWDEAEIDDAAVKAKVARNNLRRTAETLWLPVPTRSGAAELVCGQGIDHVELREGAIISSRWQPSPATRGPREPMLLKRPWARNRLAQGIDGRAGAGNPAWSLPRVVTAVSLVTATGCAIHAAYWGGTVVGAEQRLVRLNAGTIDLSSEAGRIDQLRKAAAADQRWVQDYRDLGRSLDLPSLIAALERPLREHGAVVKELEIRDQDARLSLVAIGQEIDLPSLLQSLEKLPGLDNVQVRQNTDPTQAVYGMRLQGYRPLVPAARQPSLAETAQN